MNLQEESTRRMRLYRLLICLICVITVTSLQHSASAQCTNPPPSNIVESQVAVGGGASSSSIGMDAQGRFIIAFQQYRFVECLPGYEDARDVAVRHYCQDAVTSTSIIQDVKGDAAH